jgi:hypothetical protein
MRRSIAIARTDRASNAPALLFCLLAAIPLLAPHGHDHAHSAPGARTAFQLLGSNPSREVKIAVRSLIAVITVPFAAR